MFSGIPFRKYCDRHISMGSWLIVFNIWWSNSSHFSLPTQILCILFSSTPALSPRASFHLPGQHSAPFSQFSWPMSLALYCHLDFLSWYCHCFDGFLVTLNLSALILFYVVSLQLSDPSLTSLRSAVFAQDLTECSWNLELEVDFPCR